jgi:hypothetical protein
MASSTEIAPTVYHILGDKPPDGVQRCILCGAVVASHFLGALPAGRVFEQQGRLLLIEPDEETISCLDRPQ